MFKPINLNFDSAYIANDPWRNAVIYTYEVNTTLNLWTPETWEPGTEEEEQARWQDLKRVDDLTHWVEHTREAARKKIQAKRRVQKFFSPFLSCLGYINPDL